MEAKYPSEDLGSGGQNLNMTMVHGMYQNCSLSQVSSSSGQLDSSHKTIMQDMKNIFKYGIIWNRVKFFIFDASLPSLPSLPAAARADRPTFRCHAALTERELVGSDAVAPFPAVCWARDQLLLGGEMLCAAVRELPVGEISGNRVIQEFVMELWQSTIFSS